MDSPPTHSRPGGGSAGSGSFLTVGFTGIAFYAASTGNLQGNLERGTTIFSGEKMVRVAKVSETLFVASYWDSKIRDATLFRVVDADAAPGHEFEPVLHFSLHQKGGRFKAWGVASVPSTGFEAPRVVTGANARATVWDSKTGTMIAALPDPPRDRIYCVRCAPGWDNEVQVSGGQVDLSLDGDTTIRRYDLTRGKVVLKHEGHKQTTTGLDVDYTRSALASSSKDQTCRIWTQQDPKSVLTLRLNDVAYSLASLGDLNLVAAGLKNSHIEIWDLRNPKACLRDVDLGGGHYDQLWELARISRDRLVAVSYSACNIVSLDGKTKIGCGKQAYGVCGFGTEYDRAKVHDVRDADEEERIHFCSETVVPPVCVVFSGGESGSSLPEVRFYRWSWC